MYLLYLLQVAGRIFTIVPPGKPQTIIKEEKIKLQNKTSTQKSVAFVYTNNEHSPPKFYTYDYIKRIKYLEINVTKEVKDLYTENYKTLLKEIK